MRVTLFRGDGGQVRVVLLLVHLRNGMDEVEPSAEKLNSIVKLERLPQFLRPRGDGHHVVLIVTPAENPRASISLSALSEVLVIGGQSRLGSQLIKGQLIRPCQILHVLLNSQCVAS